ncbi:hypothetical protein CHK_0826 [Christensenella hongkongensis]|uniref:Uncharacterized protein n=1 Tax=Christensenella hongkongensis TaxID=270498 RepID=A0A0M2NGJ4_9FIRM|nr:hypothetical protein CHK_0826 [Christensenella hongkongensis]
MPAYCFGPAALLENPFHSSSIPFYKKSGQHTLPAIITKRLFVFNLLSLWRQVRSG